MTKSKKKRTRWHEPRKVFEAAELARLAAILLSEEASKNGGQQAYFPSFAVVASWTLELYLKCLILEEGKRLEDSHDVVGLFDRLDTNTQAAVRREHEEMQRAHPGKIAYNEQLQRELGPHSDFDRELESSRDAFVRVRYFYESNNPTAAPGDILECVRRQITARHPDWIRDFGGYTLQAGP